jgi:hypothetical protein
MPGGRHKFEFVGRAPLALWVLASLLFANTGLMLSLDFGSKYFHPKQAPKILSWYSDHSIVIQIILLVLLAAVFIIFRKRVRYTGRV